MILSAPGLEALSGLPKAARAISTAQHGQQLVKAASSELPAQLAGNSSEESPLHMAVYFMSFTLYSGGVGQRKGEIVMFRLVLYDFADCKLIQFY